MDILRQGVIRHNDPLYVFNCYNCGAVFTEYKSECQLEFFRNEYIVSHVCPTEKCGRIIYGFKKNSLKNEEEN